jgi:transposase
VPRFPTKAHFASYAGMAPLEASSGEVVRHRLSLAVNRKLNRAPCTWSPRRVSACFDPAGDRVR